MLVLGALAACPKPQTSSELSVAAATSLHAVMPELVRGYEAHHPGRHVAVTYGASGELKHQVAAGAPVDAVFFAGARPVDELIAEGRVDAASRRVVASNTLVLVGRAGGRPLTFASLTALPPGERLAVGDPRTVPAGEYARDYLTALGEWDALAPRLVYGANVAAVLVYARRGEAAAAIVYRTEARGTTDLVVLDEARGPAAPEPKVVAGRVKEGRPEAVEFIAFVRSEDGEKTLADFGFGPP